MKIPMTVLLFLAMAVLAFPALAEDYCNPIALMDNEGTVRDAADPFVMRYNGRYYLYCTPDATEISVFESTDLVNWAYRGYCTENGEGTNAYAPEVFYYRGEFYMIASPDGQGHYIMKSDSPLGPFCRITGNIGYSIDGSFFTTDDGTLYLLYQMDDHIRIAEMDLETMNPRTNTLSTEGTAFGWTEGPGLIRRGAWYYLTFTGNDYLNTGYRVAWASRKDDPVGSYAMQWDHVMLINSVQGDTFTGLGHSSNFYGPDLESIYTSYHSHAPVQDKNYLSRWYNLDRLLTNGGSIYSIGASGTSMPDVYGDVQGDAKDFALTEEGAMASVPAATRFTQECNFALEGGKMRWRIGTRNGQPACIVTDGRSISYVVGDETVATAAVPELGVSGRLHTLRVEHTEDVMYVAIDSMRLLTVEKPGAQADVIGALAGEGVWYSYLAHTARALGDGDLTAIKRIPGRFDAVHAVNRNKLTAMIVNDIEEEALLLGSANYNVRIAEAGAYCFDLTVRAEDAGKTLSLLLDGALLMELTVPEEAAEGYFTFTSPAVNLPAGDFTLTIAATDVALWNISSFAYEVMPERTWDFTQGDAEDVTLMGYFEIADGALQIEKSQTGFAVFGTEGCTDYEVSVTLNVPKQGFGSSGILIHATDVSCKSDQKYESAFAYGISLTNKGLTVWQWNYGMKGEQYKAAPDGWKDMTEIQLTIRMENNVMTIFLNSAAEPIFTLREAMPATHGMFGFFSTGRELQVKEVMVKPLDR